MSDPAFPLHLQAGNARPAPLEKNPGVQKRAAFKSGLKNASAQ